MVIAHGSAGIQPKDTLRWVPLLNQMGIATFAVDSFKPRKIDRSDEDQSVLDQSANDADALAALKLLASDPRIDPLLASSQTFQDYDSFAATVGRCVTCGDVTTANNPAAPSPP